MNKAAQQLADNLLIASKIALGAEGSIPSPIDRHRLYGAVVAIEDSCVIDGVFNWNNAQPAPHENVISAACNLIDMIIAEDATDEKVELVDMLMEYVDGMRVRKASFLRKNAGRA
jgi:hypothetical protein